MLERPNRPGDAHESLKKRLMEQLRDPLLVAIEREWNRLVIRENIVLSRAEYKRLKWDIVKTIVNGDE